MTLSIVFTASRSFVRKCPSNISYSGMCVFLTLTCLHRVGSGRERDTLRAISSVYMRIGLIWAPATLCFLYKYTFIFMLSRTSKLNK